MDERNQYKKLAEQQYNECQTLRKELLDAQEEITRIKFER